MYMCGVCVWYLRGPKLVENLLIRTRYVLAFSLVVTLSILGRDTPALVMNIRVARIPLPTPFTGQSVTMYCVCPVRSITTVDRHDVEMGLPCPLGRGDISSCEVMEGRVNTPALFLSPIPLSLSLSL